MRVSDFITVLITLMIIGCNNVKEENYPAIVKEKNLQKYYDESMWLLYSIYFDARCDNVKCYENTIPKYTLGCYNFGLLKAEINPSAYQHETPNLIELKFKCYLDSCSICISTDSDYDIDLDIVNTFVFEKDNYVPISIGGGRTYNNSFDYWLHDKISPNSLQRKNLMKKFLLENKNYVNKWFFAEAQKRGILN